MSFTGFADDVHSSHTINSIITDDSTVLKSEINLNKHVGFLTVTAGENNSK